MTVSSYSPLLVEASIFGIPIDGFADGSFIRIQRDEEVSKFKKAMDGSQTVTLDDNGTYRITLTLMSSSPSNDWIHLIMKLYEKTGIEFIIPFTVTYGGKTILAATNTFFSVESSTEFDTAATNSEWTLVCPNAAYTKMGLVETSDTIDKLQKLTSMIGIVSGLGIDVSDFVNLSETLVESIRERIETSLLGGLL